MDVVDPIDVEPRSVGGLGVVVDGGERPRSARAGEQLIDVGQREVVFERDQPGHWLPHRFRMFRRRGAHRRLTARLFRRGFAKQLHRDTIVFVDPPPANFGPNIVPAAGGNDRESLSGELSERGQLVLGGAELLQGLLRFDRQQLVHDADDGVE